MSITEAETKDTASKIRGALAEIKAEYLEPHDHPWLVAFSGGKDSTLVLHLVLTMLLELPPSMRRRAIHVIGNDTLVESPVYAEHFRKQMKRVAEGAEALGIPVSVTTTTPEIENTFWVCLIGLGYPPPTRIFRWCTTRMKIRPTTGLIASSVQAHGGVVLVTGVRSSESSSRAKIIAKYAPTDGGRLSPHEVPGCRVFKPISGFETEEVWTTLLQHRPPWGGSYRELVTLYRNANGGDECPLVTSKEEAPGCGTGSARFGCWVCTVIKKDNSLSGLIGSGEDRLIPLAEFRDWLKGFREEASNRWSFRRDGSVRHAKKSGSLIPGPFTLAARRTILDRLQATEKETGLQLITEAEVARIQHLWVSDIALLAKMGHRT